MSNSTLSFIIQFAKNTKFQNIPSSPILVYFKQVFFDLLCHDTNLNDSHLPLLNSTQFLFFFFQKCRSITSNLAATREAHTHTHTHTPILKLQQVTMSLLSPTCLLLSVKSLIRPCVLTHTYTCIHTHTII